VERFEKTSRKLREPLRESVCALLGRLPACVAQRLCGHARTPVPQQTDMARWSLHQTGLRTKTQHSATDDSYAWRNIRALRTVSVLSSTAQIPFDGDRDWGGNSARRFFAELRLYGVR